MPDKPPLDAKAKAEFKKAADRLLATADHMKKLAARAAAMDNQMFDLEKALQ